MIKKKQENEIVLKNLYKLFEAREKILDGSESKIFSINSKGLGLLNTNHSKLKILTPKQMIQRLPIALAQVRAGNNSENLLNKIRQIVIFCINQKKSLKKYITI